MAPKGTLGGDNIDNSFEYTETKLKKDKQERTRWGIT